MPAPEHLQMGGFIATMITLLLFVGAIGKSAQIPLIPGCLTLWKVHPGQRTHTCCDNVTAGVYMVVRCNCTVYSSTIFIDGCGCNRRGHSVICCNYRSLPE
jgi:hypothetical protein